MDDIDLYLDETAKLAAELPREALWPVVSALREARRQGRFVFIIGNGGSAATASHLANDLVKAANPPGGPRFKPIALTDSVPTLLAYGNDCGFEAVFAEPLDALASRGDVLVAFSGSGNSANVLRALELARQRGLLTIGLSGRDGGRMKGLCDLCVTVPAEGIEHIEDMHLVIAHLLVVALRQEGTG